MAPPQAQSAPAQGDIVRVQTYFVYPVSTLALAPGANASVNLPIDSATDFLWFKGTYFAQNSTSTGGQTNASRIVPSVKLNIQVTGADRNLFNDDIPIPAVFGEQGVPMVLPAPMVFLANSNVKFTFTSQESSRTLDVFLALMGLKDYGTMRRGAAAQQPPGS